MSIVETRLSIKFSRSFLWTLGGSITYESIKVAHCFLLLKLMPVTLYGAMGSIFGLIYLTTYIADLGATNSLPPFLKLISRSRSTFVQFLLRYSLVPHLPIVIGCSAIATMVAASKVSLLPALLLIPSIIVLESIRTFLRMLLHTTFLARGVVLIELSIFFAYLAAIWIPYSLGTPLSLNTIFIPHLLDSIACVLALTVLLIRYINQLPVNSDTLPGNLVSRLVSTRLSSYMLRVTRNMFTSNFLTPLFAIRFGLAAAGTLYMASMMVNALQSIIKSAIGYPGNALLAAVKGDSEAIRRHAFTTIGEKLLMLIAPIVIIILINARTIISFNQQHSVATNTLALALVLLLASLTEYFFMLYEQFYIVEEATRKLFLLKIMELGALYGLVTSSVATSPIRTIAGLVAIRVVGLVLIATHAWFTWKVMLPLKPSRYLIFISVLLGLLVAAII